MPNFLKRVILFVFYYFKIREIKQEGMKEFERRVAELQTRLKHDVTVSDDDLIERVLEEAELIRKIITEETVQKINRLLLK